MAEGDVSFVFSCQVAGKEGVQDTVFRPKAASGGECFGGSGEERVGVEPLRGAGGQRGGSRQRSPRCQLSVETPYTPRHYKHAPRASHTLRARLATRRVPFTLTLSLDP